MRRPFHLTAAAAASCWLALSAPLTPVAAEASPIEAVDPLANAFGGPFELTDHEGNTVTEASYPGKFKLVTFGYTYCPDVCPITLGSWAVALDELGALADDLQPLFVSVDPERDSSKVMSAYVAAFHPSIVGLSGTEPQVKEAVRAYKVHRRKVVTDPDAPERYLVDHGSLTYLMGPDGGFRTLVPYGTPPVRLAEVLRSYLRTDRQL